MRVAKFDNSEKQDYSPETIDKLFIILYFSKQLTPIPAFSCLFTVIQSSTFITSRLTRPTFLYFSLLSAIFLENDYEGALIVIHICSVMS